MTDNVCDSLMDTLVLGGSVGTKGSVLMMIAMVVVSVCKDQWTKRGGVNWALFKILNAI
jgi:ABC-type antimicrobial peptide transport system ATPase subunit